VDADWRAPLRPGRPRQDAEGFFASRVAGPGLHAPDRNGFATVQVLRALGRGAREMLGEAVRDAALSAVSACRNPTTDGFRFWPLAARPTWAPALPDDADDTALMAEALYAAGRLSLTELRRIACRTVVRHRLAAIAQPGPPWPRVGAFKTWMRPGLDPDLADCTVNANVVSLLATAQLTRVPGYAEACAMICDAVAWAADDEARAASLSPFYPEPGELVLAVEAAAAAGVVELRQVCEIMASGRVWRRARARAHAGEPVICGSPYGLLRWRSEAVGWARAVSGQAQVPGPTQSAPSCALSIARNDDGD
jgi:hypothetical protein